MRIAQRAVRIAAHLTIALSLAFATFLVLDYFNPLMSFVSNEVSTPLLGLFCALSLAVSLTLLRRDGMAHGAVRDGRIGANGGHVSSSRSRAGVRRSGRSRNRVTIR